MSGAMRGTSLSVHAACIRGVEAIPVTVEISMAGGIPGITVVGRADSSVLEARSRIRCALRCAGYEIPRKRITVNLAPADFRKTGTGLDLPIAAAILAASGQIPSRGLDRYLLVGELALDGTVCAVPGGVAYQLLARDCDLTLVGAPGIDRIPLADDRLRVLSGIGELRRGVEQATGVPCQVQAPRAVSAAPDFSDVVGQEVAKRALTIAAAGGLGLIMVGSPGAGKTMLAQRMTTILPPISDRERQEALCIHSVCGESIDAILAGRRPFRSPHHSISGAGLIGGGRPVRPGEISLAHGGVLFLDELAEFPSRILQLLRQPMEEGCVRIVRADGGYTFPSRFQLLAATNPCPCGYLGDPEVPCTCSVQQIARYRAKLSGPLADRIDMLVDVRRPDPERIVHGERGMSSADMRGSVEAGRAFRAWREDHLSPGPSSKTSDGCGVAGYALSAEGKSVLVSLAKATHLTARGIVRLARVARTIADLDESELVGERHVLEASMFRSGEGDDVG